MHIKMHIRTSKLANFFPGLYPRAQIQQERSENGERARVERRRGEGKEKVEGMTEGRGGRKAWGIRMGGIAPLLVGGIDATARGFPVIGEKECAGYPQDIKKLEGKPRERVIRSPRYTGGVDAQGLCVEHQLTAFCDPSTSKLTSRLSLYRIG